MIYVYINDIELVTCPYCFGVLSIGDTELATQPHLEHCRALNRFDGNGVCTLCTEEDKCSYCSLNDALMGAAENIALEIDREIMNEILLPLDD